MHAMAIQLGCGVAPMATAVVVTVAIAPPAWAAALLVAVLASSCRWGSRGARGLPRPCGHLWPPRQPPACSSRRRSRRRSSGSAGRPTVRRRRAARSPGGQVERVELGAELGRPCLGRVDAVVEVDEIGARRPVVAAHLRPVFLPVDVDGDAFGMCLDVVDGASGFQYGEHRQS
jgi:hypothetical protein